MKILSLVLLLVAIGCVSGAGGTSTVFLTDDGFLRVDRTRKLEEAKKSKESLPAEQFPEGNWGPVTNGFQLSLRFEKIRFARGEPIVAAMLLRNTSTNILKYRVASITGRDGPIGFVVSDAGGAVKPVPTGETAIISSSVAVLAPSTQHKYVEQLNKRFDLQKSGCYTVYARFGPGFPNCREVESAKATFEVEE
jgi:hypothetical protein